MQRSTPAVGELARLVNGRMIGGNPAVLHRVVTGENPGDLAVGAHGKSVGLVLGGEKVAADEAFEQLKIVLDRGRVRLVGHEIAIGNRGRQNVARLWQGPRFLRRCGRLFPTVLPEPSAHAESRDQHDGDRERREAELFWISRFHSK